MVRINSLYQTSHSLCPGGPLTALWSTWGGHLVYRPQNYIQTDIQTSKSNEGVNLYYSGSPVSGCIQSNERVSMSRYMDHSERVSMNSYVK